jgi:hypothetical protein
MILTYGGTFEADRFFSFSSFACPSSGKGGDFIPIYWGEIRSVCLSIMRISFMISIQHEHSDKGCKSI